MAAADIHEIEERLADLTDALHEAGEPKLARPLEKQAQHFTSSVKVRRAVDALRVQCEAWRLQPEELPDLPKVHLAANRLEDVCREALGAGVIAPAPPTLKAQAQRKLSIVAWSLIGVAVLIAVPVALIELGIDITDIHLGRELPPVELPQAEEATVEVTALEEPVAAEATSGVRFAPLDDCVQTIGGARCAETAPRLWAQGATTTYELKLPNQAYGLLFSIVGERMMGGRVGMADVLLAATDETPEGRYEIPLVATYVGYTPLPCELMQRLTGSCPPPRLGKDAKHQGVGVPLVVVDVVRGDPSRRMGERRLAQAKAEAERKKAEERAQQLADAVSEIEPIMKATGKLLRPGRWEQAREQLDKLGTLFQPIEDLTNAGLEGALPEDVGALQAQFEAQRDKLTAFENKVFEETYALLMAPKNKRVPEERLMKRVARRHRISETWVLEIYTANAEEIQARAQAKAQAHLAEVQKQQQALEQRCGPLPKNGWGEVERYLSERHPDADVVIDSCMTPRLDERHCWVMHCKFKLKIEVAIEKPKQVKRYEASFFLKNETVTGYR
jgi:hypothetical protein